jgi:catechol 2,3-dioxygenase-like lactoylglutathione lyase family enzyme
VSEAAIAVIGIDHVQLAMPPGGEPAARQFYGELLGLREVPKPAALAARGGCWFAGPAAVAIHLGVDEAFVPAARAHPCLVVADIGIARRRLERSGVSVEDDHAGLAVARCYVRDPFGNRLELLDAADRGFSER